MHLSVILNVATVVVVFRVGVIPSLSICIRVGTWWCSISIERATLQLDVYEVPQHSVQVFVLLLQSDIINIRSKVSVPVPSN